MKNEKVEFRKVEFVGRVSDYDYSVSAGLGPQQVSLILQIDVTDGTVVPIPTGRVKIIIEQEEDYPF